MKFSGKEVVIVESINYTFNDGYDSLYRGRIVCDKFGAVYFSPDGKTYLQLMYGFDQDELSLDPREIFKYFGSKNQDSGKESESIVDLRKNGFNVDEIIKLKKEGVI